MAGKITFRHPDEYPSAGWIVPVRITDQQWTEMRNALNRELEPDERRRIVSALSRFRCMLRDVSYASNQDIKRTLAAIALLPPEQALDAYHHCDSSTLAALDESLYFNLGGNAILENPTGEAVSQAALQAEVPARNGRRPVGAHILLADWAIKTWVRLTGKPATIGTWDEENPSPAVRWAAVLFEVVENRRFDPRKLGRLLVEARGKVSTLR